MFGSDLKEEGAQKGTSLMNRRSFTIAAFSAAAAGLLVGLNPFSANTVFAEPTSAEKQAEVDEVKRKLDTWAKELDIAAADYFTALEAHDAAKAKMDEAGESIKAAEAEVTRLQERLGSRATAMYKSGEVSFLQVLFGATSFTEFTTSWDILSNLSDDDATLVDQSKKAKQDAQTAHGEYSAQEKIALEKQEEAEEIKAKAEETVAAAEAQIATLEAEVAELLEKERLEEERRRAEEAARLANQNNNDSNYDYSKTPTYNPITGNAVVDRAYGCIGIPYRWGAVGPTSFDCSGLVSYALCGQYKRLGTTYTFMKWPRVKSPQPGDVCTNSHHCGVYIGNGKMIHAPYTGTTICVASVHSDMIYVRY